MHGVGRLDGRASTFLDIVDGAGEILWAPLTVLLPSLQGAGKPTVEELSGDSPHAAHMPRHVSEEGRPSTAADTAAAAPSDNGHISPFGGGHPAQPLRPIAGRAAEIAAAPAPGSPEPGTPQRAQERGASLKGDSDSDAEPSAQLSADEVLHPQASCVPSQYSACDEMKSCVGAAAHATHCPCPNKHHQNKTHTSIHPSTACKGPSAFKGILLRRCRFP